MVVNWFQPTLAIRMVLESIIPPNGDRDFSDRALEEIQEEIGYWNAGSLKIVRATSYRSVIDYSDRSPIPIKLYFRQKRGDSVVWKNYGKDLVGRHRAAFGGIDLRSQDYFLHSRPFDVFKK